MLPQESSQSLRAGTSTQRQTRSVRRLSPCFEARNRATSKQLEAKAVAKLPETARAWLEEDVRYIIWREERCAFLTLRSDDQRERFIKQFWNRRTPDPDSIENDYQEEHYRRIAFADEKFEAQVPGWKTDRGRIYVQFGPPDQIESFPYGGCPNRGPGEQECGDSFPFESWRYRYLKGLGQMELEFVDPGATGDYRLVIQDEDRDKPLRIADDQLASPDESFPKTVEAIASLKGIEISPKPKFKELEAILSAGKVSGESDISLRLEYKKATHATTVAQIVVDIPSSGLISSGKETSSSEKYELYGEVSDLSGRVVMMFERSGSSQGHHETNLVVSDREITLPLSPGSYRLGIAVKEVASGTFRATYSLMDVPTYDELVAQDLARN